LISIFLTVKDKHKYRFPQKCARGSNLSSGQLRQNWSNFNNYFAFALSEKLQKKPEQMLQRHLNYAATLPCEIWTFNCTICHSR